MDIKIEQYVDFLMDSANSLTKKSRQYYQRIMKR